MKQSTRLRWRAFALAAALVAAAILRPACAVAVNTVYLMNDDHVDYGWNDTVPHYETAILGELDYYRSRVDATAGSPAAEQAHFNCDGWFSVWLYQHNRSAAQFQDLINKMVSGHITAPLNPMVTLYGALPTEAAIRAGYYPGKLQRQYGVPFLLGQDIENATSPWGLPSLWAGSGAKYTWKGICGCATAGTSSNRSGEVFKWQGPDNKTVLMKWYYLGGSSSWGGYAEARDNLSQPAIQTSINHFSAQPPLLPITGLFGGGWDDVSWQTSQFETLAQQWNAAHPGGDQVRTSNGVSYFQDLENYAGQLTTLRGGWGNEWDLWPATLGERTAQTRRAIEQLHAAEGMSAVVHKYDGTFWAPQQAALESALVDYYKYFEHTWGVAGSVPLSSVIADKQLWAQHIDDAVSNTQNAAATSLASLFTTPNTEDRFVVFNPLSFARTDYADLPIVGSGPYVVTDVASSSAVPNQVVASGGSTYLRILASNVPSMGYRVYRYQSGSGTSFPDAATVSSNQIDGDHYRVTLGPRGELTSVIDKVVMPNRELAGANALNDFASGGSLGLVTENQGPVSVTLRRDVGGTPSRRVRATLIKNVDRVEIEDEILENYTTTAQYRYHVNLSGAQIRFEEIGGVARPGLVPTGDFLPGSRTDFMTLNHFASFATAGYTVTLSNWDAFAMQVGNSTASSFDLSLPQVSVLASGNPAGGDIHNQGGDAYVLNRFAVRGTPSAYSASAAMQMSVAHQNPLQAVALTRNQGGPLTNATQSFLSVSAPNVLVTAFKPAEESIRGWVVRLWELDGSATNFTIDASAFAPSTATAVSLIETDTATTTVNGGVVAASIGANEIKAYRFGGAPPPPTATPTGTPSFTNTPVPTATRTNTPTPSYTPVGSTYTPTLTPAPTNTAPAQSVPALAFCFDEGSGTTTADGSGNGHTATLVGSPTWVSGKFGSALRFDGGASGHQYASFGPNDSFDGAAQGTVMAWVKPTNPTGGNRAWFQSGVNGGCEWPLELSVSSSGALRVWGGAATCGATLDASAAIPNPVNDWHHLAYAVDSSGNKLYVDGQPVSPSYAAGSASSALFFAQTATGVTQYRIGSTETASETFDGAIDEFRIYTTPLSQAQIQVAMNTPACASNCFEVPNDNCPCIANPGQSDSDGDGIGDACDLCTTTIGGQTAWTLPRLTLRSINDGVSGNDHVSLRGRFTMATGGFTVDPLSNGTQIEIRNAQGVRKAFVTLPSGSYVMPGPGWLRSKNGKRYVFRDRRPGGTNGVTYFSVGDRSLGAVQFELRGSKGTLGIVPGDVPLAATVVFGGAASGAAGECGEIKFDAALCRVNAAGTRITCK